MDPAKNAAKAKIRLIKIVESIIEGVYYWAFRHPFYTFTDAPSVVDY